MTDENDGQDQAEQHRDAEAVNEPRQHVAALVVGAEPIVFEVAAAFEALALDHRLALRFGQHPGRRRGRRRRQVEIVRRVGIADRRPDHQAALVGDQLLQIRDRDSPRRFRSRRRTSFPDKEDHREIGLAVVAEIERLVVGDEFGEQRDEEQDQENPQRPVAAPVGLEILPAPFVERRQREPPGGGAIPSGPVGSEFGRLSLPGHDGRGGLASLPTAVGWVLTSTSHLPRFEIDARVDPGIGQVGDQIHDESDKREDVEIGEHHRIVAIEHALEAE